jgi:hypothetical protein
LKENNDGLHSPDVISEKFFFFVKISKSKTGNKIAEEEEWAKAHVLKIDQEITEKISEHERHLLKFQVGGNLIQ